jgi:Tfp pilus assembly protein PilF
MGSIRGNLFGRGTPTGASRQRIEALYEKAAQATAARNLREALKLLEEVIALDPEWAEPHYKRANVLKDSGELEAAVAGYSDAIARKPDYAYAYCNRGVVLLSLGRSAEAVASLRCATELEPADSLAHYNLALSHQERLEWREALASYDKAIEANPGYADAQYNRAVLLLFMGDFLNGWQAYEWRWENAARLGIGAKRNFHKPGWLGSEPIANKTLLLHAEAGLGDTLQFCRYAPLCAQQDATVILEVPAPLVELVKTLEGVADVIAMGERLPPFDYHCPLMSLPLALGTTLDSVPASTPYLRASEAKVAYWRNRLGESTRPRIGLAWSGNPRNPIDARRSIRLAELLEHLPAGFDYFCLQTELRSADRETLERQKAIVQFEPAQLDIPSTAALCECMDLVISVDTSIAHLSGALGCKTWVLLPRVPDWRWMQNRDDSPWYPSMRLYRQGTPGEWAPPLERIVEDLRGEFHRAR